MFASEARVPSTRCAAQTPTQLLSAMYWTDMNSEGTASAFQGLQTTESLIYCVVRRTYGSFIVL